MRLKLIVSHSQKHDLILKSTNTLKQGTFSAQRKLLIFRCEGKTIAVYDVDVRSTHTEQTMQKKESLGVKYSWVKEIGKHHKNLKNTDLWLNNDYEFYNPKEECIAHTIVWLVHKVEMGWDIREDDRGVVTSIPKLHK
ncbi:hypothetical protein B0H10DRAFT_1944604 [Mycena sp. CBHHK59/15]|nr:hypothetical protein B0H10DRAFT_1944604 [Mycena sp. CBHHK59/15]